MAYLIYETAAAPQSHITRYQRVIFRSGIKPQFMVIVVSTPSAARQHSQPPNLFVGPRDLASHICVVRDGGGATIIASDMREDRTKHTRPIYQVTNTDRERPTFTIITRLSRARQSRPFAKRPRTRRRQLNFTIMIAVPQYTVVHNVIMRRVRAATASKRSMYSTYVYVRVHVFYRYNNSKRCAPSQRRY